MILFAIGINDSRFFTISEMNQTPLTQFIENIQTLINRAREHTNNIVILCLTNIDEFKTQPIPRRPELFYNNEQIQRYDQQLQTICKQENIPFIPLQGVIEKEDLDNDGLHPNSQGHKKIAQQVREKISL
ncbi:MAG: SGNH/GDSL hydrolase family protein [Candidatus Peribacteria bacterium]|jgi:lysophospholipase L1-like esterase|nr:SGNH/GDSL hydrolase family protein [Candidatus Peribacteria bacterium]